MIGFTPAIFKVLEKEFSYFLEKYSQELKSEFYIPTVIDKLIQNYEANVRVLKTKAKTFGVTYADDKTSVKNMLNSAVDKGEYPKLYGYNTNHNIDHITDHFLFDGHPISSIPFWKIYQQHPFSNYFNK